MNNKERYYKYISSLDWNKLRQRLIKERGDKCEKCGSTEFLQVHHKTYRNVYKEKDEDLQVLCRRCHFKTHHPHAKMDKRRINYGNSFSSIDLLDAYDNRKGCCDICGERKSWSGHLYLFFGSNVIMGCKKHFPRWIKRITYRNVLYIDEYLSRKSKKRVNT